MTENTTNPEPDSPRGPQPGAGWLDEPVESEDAPEILETIAEEDESDLTLGQLRRIEALYHARQLITTESVPTKSTGFFAAIGTVGGDRLLGRSAQIAGDLVGLASYIIGDEEPLMPPGFSIGTITVNRMPDDLRDLIASSVVIDDIQCDNEKCACKIAAEFTGGEVDMPTPTPVVPEGWSVPDAVGEDVLAVDSEKLDDDLLEF